MLSPESSRRAVDQPLLPDLLARSRHRKRYGPVGAYGLVENGHERGVELGDEDADGAAAGEADLEGRLVGDAVLDESRRTAGEHLFSLLQHGRLDAAAGHRPRDLASVRKRQ